MQEVRRRRETAWIGLRARAPLAARLLAVLVMVGGLLAVGVSYWRARNNKPFRLKPGAAELSSNVVSRTDNFERRISEGGRLSLVVRAASELVFEDRHRELEAVHVEHYPKTGSGAADQIDARRAIYDDERQVISFAGNVRMLTGDGLAVNTESFFYEIAENKKRAESDVPLTFMREGVRGRADAGVVDSINQRLNLRGNVEITVEPKPHAQVGGRSQLVTIRAPRLDFDQLKHHLACTGGATAEQGRDIMSGETLSAQLDERQHVQRIEARANGYLRSMGDGHAAEVHAVNFDFVFGDEQRLQSALASRDVRARTLDADSEMTLTAQNDLQVNFAVQGEQSLLREMRAAGRAVVTLAAPRSHVADARAANKRLSADAVNLLWRTTGRDLERAEAVGNAELIVQPVQSTPNAERRTLRAPRFDGDFYEAGNLARTFNATGGARAVFEPLQPTATRGTRTLTAQQMTANFVRDTQTIERIDAQGNAKFNERERNLTAQKMSAQFAGTEQTLERVEAQGDAQFSEGDRNGQAANITYTPGDEMVRLRGGEPVVWDARARVKAVELDSDLRRQVSYGRGRTQTTYYSQEQTGGATPFAKVKSPVFVVAASAEFQHAEGVGTYTGDARAWQDDNFVRADKLIIRRESKRMEGEGHVQTALYQARAKDIAGARAVVPVFATSNRMFYSEADRLLHYEGAVDIKQGTERITGESSDVFLAKDTNEMERTVAQRDVVLTQPGRKGTGERAEYTAADETVVLTGTPARVEDAEQGTSEGRRLTVYLRENRVVADSAGASPATGRVRTTHKIRRP